MQASRRTFLKELGGSTIGVCAAPLASTLVSGRQNTVAEPAPVVDTHMHVWSGDPTRFPFAHPYNVDFSPPEIAGTMEMLLEEMDSYGISHAVLVQVIHHGWDNRYVAHCLRTHPTRFRAQGLIDPTDPQVAEKLEYWVAEHGFSGMRFSPIYYSGRDQWLNAKSSYPLWRAAERLGALFNLFITTRQLPRLEDMVQRFPEVKVVIDHLARIDLTVQDPSIEFDKLLALARYPNVWAKVSELNILSPSKKYPYRDTFGWVKLLYEAFGAERLLWGTGFPGAARAQAGRPPLSEELELIRSEIPFFTLEERRRILGSNAVSLWRF